MKIKFHHIAILALTLASASCKLDNVKPPSVTLKGQLTYKGSPVGVEYNQVPFQIFQTGYAGNSPISGTFDQDGNYSILTFSGNYKFTIKPGQGPFQWKELPSGARDSLAIALTGDQTVNIEVLPYYMVRNAQVTSSGGNINAVFSIEKDITDASARDIEKVSLFINKTQFVSAADHVPDPKDQVVGHVGEVDLDGSAITDMNNVALSLPIPALLINQNYVYARVGIKIAGVEDWLLSPLIKVSF